MSFESFCYTKADTKTFEYFTPHWIVILIEDSHSFHCIKESQSGQWHQMEQHHDTSKPTYHINAWNSNHLKTWYVRYDVLTSNILGNVFSQN